MISMATFRCRSFHFIREPSLTCLSSWATQVQKEQSLYTIKSPDLIQAESNLIGAAATFELTNKELERAKSLNGANGVSQRELEQATSDQQTAEGALKAARDAVRVFGKTDAEIDQMIASRKIDPALVVRSPIAGKVTSKNAQPGFLVQPGSDPAPYTVSDVSLKWMLADVVESDISTASSGTAGPSGGDGLPWPRVQRKNFQDLLSGRSEHSSSNDPLRDRGSPTMNCGPECSRTL